MTTHRTVADRLREAAQKIPRMYWGRTNTTIHIPKTEDWAGNDLSIRGLYRPVGKAYARHIAAASPANVLSLIEERDELLSALQGLYEVATIEDEKDYAAVTKAAAVIAKATGERQ